MKYYVTSKISENIHETPEGFLLCIGVPIARTGWQVYGPGETPLEVGKDGKVHIYRDPKEVFRPETMASYEGKSFVVTHPEEFVGPDNWKDLTRGLLQNIRKATEKDEDGEESLLADILVTERIAIGLVKKGLREVSCGYDAEYTQTEEGRGVQTNIIGNHLALVDEGRAGSSYAINDHKGKGVKMKLSEKIKAIFAKAQDEAMTLAKDAEPDDKKKDDDKKEPAKDAPSASYDELVNMVKDLGEKIAAMGKSKEDKPKDATSPATENEPAKTVAKDDEPAPKSLEDRMNALEAAVAKLLESKAPASDEDGDDDEEEESEDDDFDESTMTGDTASRVEILSPGMKITKDAKVKSLKAAYETQEGKKIIDSLSGGKAPTFDSAEKVDTLFIAASEILKATRTSDFSKTKQTRDFSTGEKDSTMTAEKMNEINAKHYGKN